MQRTSFMEYAPSTRTIEKAASTEILPPEKRNTVSCDLCMTHVSECLQCMHLEVCQQGMRALDQETAPKAAEKQIMETPLPSKNSEGFYADAPDEKPAKPVKTRCWSDEHRAKSAEARREKAKSNLLAALKSGFPVVWYFVNTRISTWDSAQTTFCNAKRAYPEINEQSVFGKKSNSTSTEIARLHLMLALISGDPESWYFKTLKPEKWETAVQMVAKARKKYPDVVEKFGAIPDGAISRHRKVISENREEKPVARKKVKPAAEPVVASVQEIKANDDPNAPVMTIYVQNEDNSEQVMCDILQNICVLSTTPAGWTKELNLVSWHENEPRLDIRTWSPDHTTMSKGITLLPEEASALYEVLGKHLEEQKEAKKAKLLKQASDLQDQYKALMDKIQKEFG